MLIEIKQELAPGDITRLEADDFIPAEARLLRNASLRSEEFALTGESVPYLNGRKHEASVC